MSSTCQSPGTLRRCWRWLSARNQSLMREHLSDVDKRKTNGLLITSTANLELGAVPWPVFESPLQQFLIRSATPPPSHGEMEERPRRRRGPVAPDGDGTSRDA